ncbi:ABC transporter permease [Spirochaeta thermophila]|uniref:Putative permease involved in lipoprotein release n=1 Tax=Winmispira thermophila (strain ATCC 49972 / DSM 6192 / RI 19.B1) TaxID=665571 RepID=E0RNQ8_WINT6|nr:FtsX-like permease family protein [Spirochaeta thermophila]ADN01181.1 putative permease involved in lipoprotein release [Spirochaeta thermophila DSM 6192]
MKLSQIAWRNIFRNRRRSLLSVLALAIAAMSLVLLFGLIDWMKDDFRTNLFRFYTGQIRIRDREFDTYEHLSPLHLKVEHALDLVEKIEQIPGVRAAAARIGFPAMVLEEEGTFLGVYGRAMDMEQERKVANLDEYLLTGEFPKAGSREILLTPSLAEELGKQVGDTLTLMARTATYGTNAMTFTITGLVRFPFSSLDRAFFIPLDTGQRLLRMRSQDGSTFDAASEVVVLLEEGVKERDVLPHIQSLLATGSYGDVEARPWQELPTLYSVIRITEITYNVIGLLFLLLGSTVIINTTMMVIYERMREIGTMSAMGMEGGQLVRLFFLEALYLALIGAAVGVGLGALFAYPLGIYGIDYTAATQDIQWPVSSIYYCTPTWRTYLFVFLFSVVVGAVTSFIPSRRAAKLNPIQALRTI